MISVMPSAVLMNCIALNQPISDGVGVDAQRISRHPFVTTLRLPAQHAHAS